MAQAPDKHRSYNGAEEGPGKEPSRKATVELTFSFLGVLRKRLPAFPFEADGIAVKARGQRGYRASREAQNGDRNEPVKLGCLQDVGAAEERCQTDDDEV